MIGWHYTSVERWKIIQREGLVPQPVRTPPEVVATYDGPLFGVWVWEREQTGRALWGETIWMMMRHATERVVALRIEYTEDEVARDATGRRVIMRHDGIGNRGAGVEHHPPVRWHDGEPALLIGATIPPERVTLVSLFEIQRVAEETAKQEETVP